MTLIVIRIIAIMLITVIIISIASEVRDSNYVCLESGNELLTRSPPNMPSVSKFGALFGV